MSKSIYLKQLEELQQKVAKVVNEWDGGCVEGKKNFLEDVGLGHLVMAPKEAYQFKIDICFETNNTVATKKDIQDKLITAFSDDPDFVAIDRVDIA